MRMSMSAWKWPSAEDQNEASGTYPCTLLLCDLVDSTALMDRLGDIAGTNLVRQHDQLARTSMARHGGREIDKTDGFLVLFERPIQAAAFALEYQEALRNLARSTGQPMNARVAIHYGEIVIWANSAADIGRGARPVEIEGMAVPVTARLMTLARPGQILLSEVASTMARRAELRSAVPGERVVWLAHGRYRFKGVADPVAIHEVGEKGHAPLKAPPSSVKAWPVSAWWRRPPAVALWLLLLGVAAVPAWFATFGNPILANGYREWVVIGDFAENADGQKFAPTLNTAFRIGIQQSRFVNVVPDVTVRQTLTRMQRATETGIDRGVGSEIALREQARALIVPSITRYGTRYRLVAEVVDPGNGLTVSVQTADATSAQDLLAALDKLIASTRYQLGESMNQITANSLPLQKVATPNLEALKILAREQEVGRDGDMKEAELLLRQAIDLDPDFAAAYRTLASVLFEQARYAEGRAALQKSLSIPGRLSEREQMYSRAFLDEFSDPSAALNEWRAFATRYGDNGTGQNNAGNLQYMVFQNYASAESALRSADIPRNPYLNYTLQMLGHTLLVQGKVQESQEAFRAALKFSPAPVLFGLSDALAVGGRFAEAEAYLDEPRQDSAAGLAERELRRATLRIDQGSLPEATAAVRLALERATQLPAPNARWRAQAALVALRVAQGDLAEARALTQRQLGELVKAAQADAHLTVVEQLLYMAGWAARLGLVDAAHQALAVVQHDGLLERFPVRAALAQAAAAEIELQNAHPDRALPELQPKPGVDLWETHELRARVFRARHDKTGELAELTWLAGHRGQAYGQWIDNLLGQQSRVLALRDAAARLAAYGQAPA